MWALMKQFEKKKSLVVFIRFETHKTTNAI